MPQTSAKAVEAAFSAILHSACLLCAASCHPIRVVSGRSVWHVCARGITIGLQIFFVFHHQSLISCYVWSNCHSKLGVVEL